MKIYFFNSSCPITLQHDIIPIAEGLRELGYSFSARHDYWLSEPDGELLFKADASVVPEECDLVIGSFVLGVPTELDLSAEKKAFLSVARKRSGKTKVIFLDDADGYAGPSWRPEFRGCDVVLRTKYNRRTWAPKNVRPWAIGLTNRIIRAASEVNEPSERKHSIYVNYGASHPFEHTTRWKAKNLLHPALVPELDVFSPSFVDLSEPPGNAWDRLMWEQTNKRHSRIYLERMKSCLVSSAFCGDEIPPMPRDPRGYCVGGGKARLKRRIFDTLQFFDPRPMRVISGDSFRFWESMACGTAPMQVDFEHYGLQMPLQPTPFEHYLPVRFDDLQNSAKKIRSELPRLKEVGDMARTWAQQHYAPKSVATRVLEML